MFRRLYRALVPHVVRDSFWRVRHPGRNRRSRILLHEAQWYLQTGRRRAHRLNARLLGKDGFWCFILGVNNSGTTLLEKLLGRHPVIRSLPGEGQALTGALPKPWRYDVSRLWTTRLDVFRRTERDDPSPAWRAIHDWTIHYEKQEGRILLEKSPPDTIRSRWLARNFRPARFLSLVRNPYAVCEGIRRRNGYDIDAAARHWVLGNQLLLKDLADLNPEVPTHLITYEGFCEEPGETLREICDFLGVDGSCYEDELGPLRVHNLDGRPSTIRNFNARSIRRLSDEDIATITEIAGGTMEEFGYRPLDRASGE